MTTRPHPGAPRSTNRRRSPGHDSSLGGVLVDNAFLRIPVEEALAAAGLEVVLLPSPAAAHPPLRVLVAGIEELGPYGAQTVARLCRQGTAVLVFGRSEQATALRALQACGAATAERASFLVHLPVMVRLALGARRS